MPDSRSDFPEDAERLPEGFKRIAYDSDTMRFIFRDCNGQLYQGEAGAEYGILNPQSASTTSLSRCRPNAFASESPSIPTSRRSHQRQKSTFSDILPPNLITSSSLSERSPESPTKTSPTTPPREKFVRAVRKSVLPKMQGVVRNLRRSVTSIRDKTSNTHEILDEREETRGLVRSDSPPSADSVLSDIRRSATVARPRSKHLPP